MYQCPYVSNLHYPHVKKLMGKVIKMAINQFSSEKKMINQLDILEL